MRAVALAAVVLTAAGAAAVSTLGLGGGSDAAETGRVLAAVATVAVERRTLVRSATIDGKVDFGAAAPLPIKATGTITWVPKPGTVVKRGQPVLRIDDRPVVLLYGALPQYRALAAPAKPAEQPSEAEPGGAKAAAGPTPTPGATKKAAGPKPAAPKPFTGNDVKQFETNLAQLGFGGFEVDTSFTEATAVAVKRWQSGLRVTPTGKVELGDVVYARGPVRIAKVSARVGSGMSEDAVSVSGNSHLVQATASAEDLSWAKKGVKVSVQLPDDTKVAGTVTSVGGGEPPGGDDDAAGASGTVPVTVTVKDTKALSAQAGAPVTVVYISEQRKDVLCVPVSALVALAEGGYGVEPDNPGAHGFVAVQTGLFADGFVEISGPGLTEGMKVRAPE